MKRLTKRDDFGNADIRGIDSAELQLNLGFEEFNKVTRALNKLAECEDLEGRTGIEIQKLYEVMLEYVRNRDNIDPKDTCFTLLTREESGQYYKWLELYEQEKLLELPCAVGDTVWDNDFGHPYSYTVTGFSLGKLDDDEDEDGIKGLRMHYNNGSGSLRCSCAVAEIGKTVFLTREEAETALKESQGREGNGK